MSDSFFSLDTVIFLVCSALIFIWFKSYSKNRIKPPKPSVVNLPQKIYFQQNANNKYGVGTFALDIVTIGGHGRLKEARFNYEKNYMVYAEHFNNTVDIQAKINDSLNDVGAMTYKILLELDKSRKLLSQPAQGSMSCAIAPQFNNVSSQIHQLRNTANNKSHTGVALIQGTTVGGLAAVGSWTLVSMFGSASTGTAIASLSGVAAHNSILAWFGGGAIAAGGGGMAAGTLTLGAIAVVPIVLFSSYKTHSSANDLNIKTDKLKSQIPSLIRVSNELLEANTLIDQQLSVLNMQYDKISEVNKQVYNLIYPNGVFSKTKRNINNLFKQDFYTKQEVEGIDKLLCAIYDVNDLFDAQSKPSVPMLT
ncbi:hypothetical protein [Psychrobacter glacincola]|uniref:hypothetical protein n=1 Tax=Psychrobacter glacincola TaxID=56810 RepID=UPI003D070EBC